MSTIVFDIETGPAIDTSPLTEEQIVQAMRPFGPKDVKTGNMKDPAKIAEKIEAAMGEWAANERQRIVDAHQEAIDKAALSPLTGQVVAIGVMICGEQRKIIDGQNAPTPSAEEESRILANFWSSIRAVLPAGHRLVGHNIHGFDLPFLVRRSWLHGISVPAGVIENGRYWSPCFVDTAKEWGLGSYGSFVSLDSLAKFFGAGGKPDDVTGADFHRLWFGTEEDRAKATSYLENDLKMTWLVSERMGLA
jgi:hypothetical protein